VSGVAYVFNNKTAKDVTVIDRWPGNSEIVQKVPTRIAYAELNNFNTDKWGCDVEPGMSSCQWFKLLLDDETPLSDFDDPLLRRVLGEGSNSLMAVPEGKTATDVAADYLALLREYIFEVLAKRMGATNLDQTPIVWTLTMPATWSLLASQRTREAAVRAGFEACGRDRIDTIDEPEAAGIAALRGTLDSFDDKAPFQVSDPSERQSSLTLR
jgi:hypothetical protein